MIAHYIVNRAWALALVGQRQPNSRYRPENILSIIKLILLYVKPKDGANFERQDSVRRSIQVQLQSFTGSFWLESRKGYPMKITIMKKTAFVFCTLLVAGCFNEGVDPARINAFAVSGTLTTPGKAATDEIAEVPATDTTPLIPKVDASPAVAPVYASKDGSPLIHTGVADTAFFNVSWTVDASPYEYELYISDGPNLGGNEILLEKDACGSGGSYTCGQTRIIRCYTPYTQVNGYNEVSMFCDNRATAETKLITSLVGNGSSRDLYMIFKACNGQSELCRVTSAPVTMALKPQIALFTATPDELQETGDEVGKSDEVKIAWEVRNIDAGYTMSLTLNQTNEAGQSVISLDGNGDEDRTNTAIFTDQTCTQFCGEAVADNSDKNKGELTCTVDSATSDYSLSCVGSGLAGSAVDIDFTDVADSSLQSASVANFLRNLDIKICGSLDDSNNVVCDEESVGADHTRSVEAVLPLKIIQDRPLVTLGASTTTIKQDGDSVVEWEMSAVGQPAYNFNLFYSDDAELGGGDDTNIASVTCTATEFCADAELAENGVASPTDQEGKLTCSLAENFELSCSGAGVVSSAADLISNLQASVLPYEATETPEIVRSLIAQTCKDNERDINLCTHQVQELKLPLDVPAIDSFTMTDLESESKATLTSNNSSTHDLSGADALRLKWDVDVKADESADNNEPYDVHIYVRSQNTKAALLGSDTQTTSHADLENNFKVAGVDCSDVNDLTNCSIAATKPENATQYGELTCTMSEGNLLKCGSSDALDVTDQIGAGNMYLFLEVCNRADESQCRYKASAQVIIKPGPKTASTKSLTDAQGFAAAAKASSDNADLFAQVAEANLATVVDKTKEAELEVLADKARAAATAAATAKKAASDAAVRAQEQFDAVASALDEANLAGANAAEIEAAKEAAAAATAASEAESKSQEAKTARDESTVIFNRVPAT